MVEPCCAEDPVSSSAHNSHSHPVLTIHTQRGRVAAATSYRPLLCCVRLLLRQRLDCCFLYTYNMLAAVMYACWQRHHVTYTMLGTPIPVVHVLQVNLDTFAASLAQPRPLIGCQDHKRQQCPGGLECETRVNLIDASSPDCIVHVTSIKNGERIVAAS